ncbi:MAG: inositol monophosphatase family protein [Candidatus Dormibacteria bacterium]
MPDLDSFLTAALAAATAGAQVVRRGFGEAGLRVDSKGPGDYVTEVDRSSEDAVLTVLRAAHPGVPVLAEESGGALEQERVWVVDPLDGTTNFVHAFWAVGVSVALVEAGVPVVGVVTAPMLGVTWHATRGGGAWCGERRLEVGRRAAGGAVVATGFPFHHPVRRPEYLSVFSAALGEFEDLRRVGAASLDLAWTASGQFDGFFELGLSPWDVAAGALLVREAGGVVTDWTGGEGWLSQGDIMAGPSAIHARLLALSAKPG